MRRELRPDLIIWEPDRPESAPRTWKVWQEKKDPWGGGFGSVPGTVQTWHVRPSDAELLRLPQTKNHRWVVGPC